MLTVLYLADKQVKQRLFDAVQAAAGPCLVTQVRAGAGMKPIPEREPFVTLETEEGKVLHQLIIADEGKPDGMWRDPLGDLAEKLYGQDRTSAYQATQGYLLVHGGKPVAALKKGPALEQDVDQIQAALRKAGLATSGNSAPRKSAAGPASPPKPSPSARPAQASPPSAPAQAAPEDPYALLGIPPGTSRSEARRAFRALMAQYHPDKVAHLAPDFRELAERKSRAITEAWEQIQREADG